MDQRTEFVALASLEGANLSALCSRFGISRQTGYLWLGRFVSGAGLADRSRRPRTSPGRCGAELEAAIIAVREAHPAWGARKIGKWLEAGGTLPPAPSTVHAVLVRHGMVMNGQSPGRAYGRFEAEAPNRLWQMDFKGRVKLGCGNWCHPLTVIDDHSRYAVVLEACADERTATVRQRLETAMRTHGLPMAFYLDNGAPWGGGVPGQWTPLTVWMLKLGIKAIHATPYHPQGRGKNERFHRSLKAEVFALAPLFGLDHAQAAFDGWRHVYNRERPHEGIGLNTPASRYAISPRAFPDRLPEPEYAPGEIVRRVSTTKAYVSFKGRAWRVPNAFCGETLVIRPHATDGLFAIHFGATKLATIDLRTTSTGTRRL